jgi:SAM-dependent methyltransferase
MQAVILADLLPRAGGAAKSVLHVAPEPSIGRSLRGAFGTYVAGDLDPRLAGGHRVDVTDLPFPGASFDMVFASHVLEHVADDRRAIAEVRRVLRPGGIAVLPVPVLGERTIEYPEPNPGEGGHVRAPGLDYFDRYRAAFDRVEIVSSADVPDRIQPYLYEDRSVWPLPNAPRRVPSAGERHLEYVPICRVD